MIISGDNIEIVFNNIQHFIPGKLSRLEEVEFS